MSREHNVLVSIQNNASEAPPQTDELAVYMHYCLKRSDTGYWILDTG